MDSTYLFLFDLALILLSTKILGLITRKFQMPQVVGALCAGLILGPAMFNIISETEFIADTAEIGVIVLMFCAGMETDVEELKKSGKASFIIALCGVIVPLIGGTLVGMFFNTPSRIVSDASTSTFLQNIFMGIILTATSVSITVETLREMGKLKTKAGNAILGAAIIDDVLGIIALTIITSLADSSVSIAVVLIKTFLFFVFAFGVGAVVISVYKKWFSEKKLGFQRYAIVSFVMCLLMSYIAEKFFGVADITGAFFAGLIISCTQRTRFLASKFDVLSYLYLSPLFFASIGLSVKIPKMSGILIAFTISFVIIAIITKILGCGLGARMCGYTPKQSKQIGIGMISRGEVALIVASKGAAVGLLGDNFLGPIVIVVVITTIITPILLKSVFKDNVLETEVVEKGYSEPYEEIEKYRSGK